MTQNLTIETESDRDEVPALSDSDTALPQQPQENEDTTPADAYLAEHAARRPADVFAVALTAEDAPAAEFAHIDPRTLTVEANIRSDAALDRAFVASIRQHGVIVPVLVVRQADGALHVRAGQRRTLGAIEADVPTIPARIIDASDKATDRFVQQFIENDQRTALTDADRVGAFEQMSLLGMSAVAIARRVHVPKKKVTAALAVAAAQQVRDVLTRESITLDQALTLTDFTDDAETFEYLSNIAITRPESLDHEAQRARDRRERDAAAAAIREALTASGVTVLDDRPEYGGPSKDLSELAGTDGGALAAADHAQCPGHAAYIRTWGEPAAVYVCTDAKKHGHRGRYSTFTATSGGAMSEQDKAERRTVIENNKAWKSATTVRTTWLEKFAKRRTAPTGAPEFIAWAVASATRCLEKAGTEGHRTARAWLGLADVPAGYGGWDGARIVADAIRTATTGRQQVIAITLALAALEGSLTGWRNNDENDAHYLRAIAAWGYTLSDVETLILTTQDKRAAYRAQDEAAERAEAEQGEPDNTADEYPADDLTDGEVSDLDPEEYQD